MLKVGRAESFEAVVGWRVSTGCGTEAPNRVKLTTGADLPATTVNLDSIPESRFTDQARRDVTCSLCSFQDHFEFTPRHSGACTNTAAQRMH